MSEQVVARKTQLSRYGEYMPASWCAAGTCWAGSEVPDCFKTDGETPDWFTHWNTCAGGFCPGQRSCVPPDATECEIGLSSHGADPMQSAKWDGAAPHLACTFDLDKIDRYEQVQNFINTFGSNDRVMGAFCERPGVACAPGMKTCSKLKSTDVGADVCRLWFGGLASDSLRDAVATSYCYRYDTEDCRCINRSLTDEYRKLKLGNPIPDNCWFVPCANPSRYFVPSDLQKGSPCPENVCEVVFDTFKNRDVNIYDNDITCNFAPPAAPTATIVVFLEAYWPYIALVLLFAALFVTNRAF
jgi:hypothetical protein